MNLELPDNARVRIFIAPARAQSQGTRPPADDPDPPRPPEVPPAFARQLRQAPTVTPAPGAAASDATPSGAPAKSPFGLED
jgi:hypothetical protein